MSGNIALETFSIGISETAGEVLVPIVRTVDLSKPVDIVYEANLLSFADAADEDDFTPDYGTVTMEAGVSRIVVPVEILDDDVSENTESFSFSLVDLNSGTFLFPRTAQIDILDDENPVTEPTDPPLESDYAFSETTTVDGLTKPIAFEFSPLDPDVIYVAEKNGKVRLFDLASGDDLGDVLDIMDQVNQRADRGLMDIALHPDLATNPYLYTYYTVDPPDTDGKSGNAAPDGEGNRFAYLTRHTLDADNDYRTVVPGSEVILIGGAGQSLDDISGGGAVNSTSDFDTPPSDVDPDTGEYVQDYIKVDSLSHAGGSLEFGPDGALYLSTGDGTSFNAADVRALSVQSVHALAGKILRIDPITGLGLTDNPFVDDAGGDLTQNAAKVYQLGLRNPFTMGFAGEGQLLISDVGWGAYEEINTGAAGANFGWPFYEGGDGGASLPTRDYEDLDEAKAFYSAVASGDATVTPAFKAFSHRVVDPGYQLQLLIGANDVIRSDRFPSGLQGRYIFTDMAQGELYAIKANDSRDLEFLAQLDGPGPVHLKLGPDGHMYFAYLIDGKITRISLAELGNSDPIAADDTITTRQDVAVNVDVLANDDDPDEDPLSVATVSQGSNGKVSINVNGTVTYVPNAGFFGTDEFTYEVAANGGRDEGKVTVTVTKATINVQKGTPGDDTLKGTAGADRISGLAGDDIILGRGGADDLMGGAGNDRLDGGRGKDGIFGGTGIDSAEYTRSERAVVVDLEAGTGSGGHAEGDTLKSIENLRGSEFDDDLTGSALGNTLWGGGGADVLRGLLGDDSLYGGAKRDTLRGGEGRDTLQGGQGNDTIYGGKDDDTLRGGQGDDTIFGARHADLIFGNGGDDSLKGGRGADTLRGGDGADTLRGSDGNDILDGQEGSDSVFGNAGDDQLVFVFGETGTKRDAYHGGTGTDTLEIHLTRDEYESELVAAELAELEGFATGAGRAPGADDESLSLRELGLKVTSIEIIEVVISDEVA
ncbi:PQQ-dependent sugar dehydrogenase [Tropicimonas marinistellae]|uniref:PQQ-dependent sugar dehydrogenase n=1 Tax=Tropicimonas marinistellae TaxID=1739787 RepID=UPI00082B2FDE|nr:PQQ-dependent sugar dehydrogenase [Tropicimonas marinistellae]